MQHEDEVILLHHNQRNKGAKIKYRFNTHGKNNVNH